MILPLLYSCHIQICSSDFLGESWLTFLQGVQDGYAPDMTDWRYMTYAQFLLLKSLCQLSRTTVSDSIEIFGRTKVLVPQVSTESYFVAQCQAITREFYNSAQNAFGRSLDLSSVLKQGDFLVSGLGSNFYYDGYCSSESYVLVSPTTIGFFDENGVYCSCYRRAACTQAVYVYSPGSSTRIMRVPGWRSGCYTQDALLSSTLECYFNASCFDFLRRIFDAPFDVQHLAVRNSSRFNVTTPINSIARLLFVDEWVTLNNFTAYYSACAPSTCSYMIDEKRGLVVIVGTLVGIWGGLTKALDLSVPHVVHFARTKGRQWLQLLTNALRPNQIHPAH